MEMPEGSVTFADFRKLPEPFRYVAFMPQWDFLNFLTGKARHFSNFELLMRAEVTDVIEEADRGIVGVRAETPDGPLEVPATSWLLRTGGTPWCGAAPVWNRSPVRPRWMCSGFASHGAQRKRPRSSVLEVATSS